MSISPAVSVGLDATNDLELAGIDQTREHLGCQRRHAVVVFPNRADAAVGTNLGVDRDPHVQPLVAVDDVVAAMAHDRVAAVTAQDDVACAVGDGTGSERGKLHVGQAEHRCSPAMRAMPSLVRRLPL